MKFQDNPLALLRMLRTLENLHSDICNDLFQPALPSSRHALFDLLRDMESKGGWPHIPKRQLAELLAYLQDALSPDSVSDPHV